ncbi:MAG TPA: hypothetical protein VLG92_01415 [Candidatus Saccharimonadia bacterium]|nr:hypothetical protein [Candidatus Saccharimonadia bacterium]
MTKTDIKNVDPKKVGQIDADMWRAYYNHQFFKLFSQLLLLIKYQLQLNWLLTIRLAYYSAWAAADYRIHKYKGVNNKRVLKNLTKFYGLLSKYNAEPFDYKKTARLELAWWDVHRRSYKNNPELERSLADAAAALYNVNVSSLKDYAHYRAEAMILPRHEGDHKEGQTDWQKITELTIKSWQALHTVIQR